MLKRNRILLILVLVVVGLCSVAYTGLAYATSWQLVTDHTSGTAYGSPAAFAPYFAPTGNWQVYIDAPDAIRRPLETALKTELPKLTYGPCQAEFVASVPAATVGVNRITVTLTPDGHWTPVTAKFADKAEIRIITAGQRLPATDQEAVPGGINIKASLTTAAKGLGLVGRPQMNAYRANVVKDFIIKAVRDAYDELRARASQPS